MIENPNYNWYLAVLCAVILLFIFLCINDYFFVQNENGTDLFSQLTTENTNTDDNN